MVFEIEQKEKGKMNKIDINKNNFLLALEQSLGVITTAAKKADVSRTIVYQWIKDDEEFAKQVKSFEDLALDFVESQLFKQIRDDNVAATIFYLKTKGKNRGYSERTEISGPEGQNITPFQIILPRKQE